MCLIKVKISQIITSDWFRSSYIASLLFRTLPWVILHHVQVVVIVVFADHTHLLVYMQKECEKHNKRRYEYNHTWNQFENNYNCVLLRSVNLIGQERSPDPIGLYFIFQWTPVRIREDLWFSFKLDVISTTFHTSVKRRKKLSILKLIYNKIQTNGLPLF